MRKMISAEAQNKLNKLEYVDGEFGVYVHHDPTPEVEQKVEFNRSAMNLTHQTVIASGFDKTRAPEGTVYSGMFDVDEGSVKFIVDEDWELVYLLWKVDGELYYGEGTYTFYGNSMVVPAAVQTAFGVTYTAHVPAVPAYDEFKAFVLED